MILSIVNVFANISGAFWKVFAATAPAVGLLLVGPTSPATAQKSPETIRLMPQSKDGAVLLRVDTLPVDYQLLFQKVGSSGFGSRIYAIKLAPSTPHETYVARTLEPGRYRLTSIWQQKRWGLLFPKETVEFEVRAGTITFLGKLDALTLLKVLRAEAVAAGKTVSAAPGSGFSTDKHGVCPMFEARDDASLAEARAFAMRTMQARDDMVQLGDLHMTAVN